MKTDIRNLLSTPSQVPINLRKTISFDYYEKQMLKHPHRSQFISRFHLWYGALLEGDSNVVAYIPRPFKIQLEKSTYIPDFLVHFKDKIAVVDITKNTEETFIPNTPNKESAAVLFNNSGYEYEQMLISEIASQQVNAESWLNIIQRIYVARDIVTDPEEKLVLDEILAFRLRTIGEIIECVSGQNKYFTEIAILRLAHRGFIRIELNNEPLSYSSKINA